MEASQQQVLPKIIAWLLPKATLKVSEKSNLRSIVKRYAHWSRVYLSSVITYHRLRAWFLNTQQVARQTSRIIRWPSVDSDIWRSKYEALRCLKNSKQRGKPILRSAPRRRLLQHLLFRYSYGDVRNNSRKQRCARARPVVGSEPKKRRHAIHTIPNISYRHPSRHNKGI